MTITSMDGNRNIEICDLSRKITDDQEKEVFLLHAQRAGQLYDIRIINAIVRSNLLNQEAEIQGGRT